MPAASGIAIQASYKFISVTPSDTLVLKYPTSETPYPHQQTLNSPSQTIDEPAQTRGISCGTAGNIAVKNDQGTTVVIPIAAGIIHPIATYQILSTSTTALTITAFF